MNRSSILYIAILGLVLFTTCKKDEGLIEEQKESYIKTYGARSEGCKMLKTSDGGFILLGTTNYGTTSDIMLVKTDGFGNQQWSRTYDVTNEDEIAYDIMENPSGGYVICGSTKEIIDSVLEAKIPRSILMVTDANGFYQWHETFGDRINNTWNEVGKFIIMSRSGNYILGSNRDSSISQKAWVWEISINDYSVLASEEIKITDTSGTIFYNVRFEDAINASNDHFIVVGTTEFWENSATHLQDNMIMAEFTGDPGSTPIGINGNTEDDQGFAVVENASGNYVACGYQTDPATDNKSLVVIERQSPVSNTPLWINTISENATSNLIGYGINSISDGYIVAGSLQNQGEEPQLYLTKLDLNGNKLWSKNYGYIEFDEARDVVETSDGGFAIFGTSTDERGNKSMCLIKTNSKGDIN